MVSAHTVTGVKPGGPAAKAGIVAGDVVTAVDGLPVDALTFDGIQTLIANHSVGAQVKLTVLHGGQPRDMTVLTIGQ
jgi:S1-C subfamily serine protease